MAQDGIFRAETQGGTLNADFKLCGSSRFLFILYVSVRAAKASYQHLCVL